MFHISYLILVSWVVYQSYGDGAINNGGAITRRLWYFGCRVGRDVLCNSGVVPIG